MALLCATFKKNSVSLCRFPLLNHVYVIWYTIHSVCCLLYLDSYFFFQFLFFRFLFVVFSICSLVIFVGIALTDSSNQSSLALFCVFFESLNCIHSILNASESSSVFFSWHIKSIYAFSCKAFCIIINLLLICLNFSLVHFKKGSEYLMKETIQVFISLMRFQLKLLFSRHFLVLSLSFLTFSFLSIYLMVSSSNIPSYS